MDAPDLRMGRGAAYEQDRKVEAQMELLAGQMGRMGAMISEQA